MKLDGYVRVSKVNGRTGPSFISPEVQRDAIERWAASHGHEIVQWHEELDRSGGHGKKRPVFEKVIARVIDGESDGIVVWKFSRFGRSLIEAAVRLHKIEEAGGTVESATEGAQSKLTRNIMLAIAEDELDRLTESWGEARRRAVDRGVTIGGARFGYFRTTAGTLEPDENSSIVSEAFRVGAGEGFEAARRYLERQTGKNWRPDRTRRLLTSRVYLGEVICGKLVKKDAHEPLTTPERFAAVQTLPELSARPRRASADYPLSGVASCGKCGEPLVGNLQSVRGRRYRRYRCGNDVCRGVGINADKLEAYVLDRLGVALGARCSRRDEDPTGALDQAQEELWLADSDLQRWLEDHRTKELIGDERYHAGVESRMAKLDQAQQRYREVAGQTARAEVIPALTDLQDPEQFERALTVMVVTVKVKVGRGTVEERAGIEWTEAGLNVEKPFYETASEKTIEAGMEALGNGHRLHGTP